MLKVFTCAVDYLNRFALAMGSSATNYAKSRRKKKGVTMSKRGPKGLKMCGTILQAFKGRIYGRDGQNDINAEHVQKILEGVNWKYGLDEDDRVNKIYKDSDEAPKKESVKHLHIAKLLGLVCDVVHAESIEIAFDYLRLHRTCWVLLRSIRDSCHDDLTRMYDPDCIGKESKLPIIVRYVLMSGLSNRQVGETPNGRLFGVEMTDKPLINAKGCLQAMILYGVGSLIVDQVPPKIGIQMNFKFDGKGTSLRLEVGRLC
jgi:hypothetical protein